MAHSSAPDVTSLLRAWGEGDTKARDRLMPLVYGELRRRARAYLRRERGGHTLQPTALVHEAYLRLVGQDGGTWKNRDQFYGVAELRFFGGLSLEEAGRTLGISVATVEREWQAARAWLFLRLQASNQERSDVTLAAGG